MFSQATEIKEALMSRNTNNNNSVLYVEQLRRYLPQNQKLHSNETPKITTKLIQLGDRQTVHSPLFFREIVEIERVLIPDALPLGTTENQDGRH